MIGKCQCGECRRERDRVLADRMKQMFGDDPGPVSLGQGEYRTDIKPTVRRIDWAEAALWTFAAGVLFVAAFLFGYARARGAV